MIRTVSLAEGDPGLRPLAAALEEEGFEDFGAGQLAESFSRHLMTAFDTWREHGFDAVAKSYLSRLAPKKGVSRSIADHGDLLVRRQARSRSNAAGWCLRSPRQAGSIRKPEGRVEVASDHPARPLGHLRVRMCGRAR